jgi:hypothetical protein
MKNANLKMPLLIAKKKKIKIKKNVKKMMK